MSHLWKRCLAVCLVRSIQSPAASSRMAGSRLYQNEAVEKSIFVSDFFCDIVFG